MRAVTAGLTTTFVATALGVGMMQGAALADSAPSSPSAGDAGSAAGMKIADFFEALREKKDSNTASNASTPGDAY